MQPNDETSDETSLQLLSEAGIGKLADIQVTKDDIVTIGTLPHLTLEFEAWKCSLNPPPSLPGWWEEVKTNVSGPTTSNSPTMSSQPGIRRII